MVSWCFPWLARSLGGVGVRGVTGGGGIGFGTAEDIAGNLVQSRGGFALDLGH